MKKLKLIPGAPNEIIMEREFAAPRALVHRAMTEPELVKRWLGNECSALIDVQVDLRVGGSYRHVFRRPDGVEFTFTGIYRELGVDRTVHTERFNDMPGEAVVTTTLTERYGVTTMRMVEAFESAEVRDFVLGTGMADGAGLSYDNLERLLSEL
ncbi:MAG: SRPBCC domain-containing protein [Kofleriaceae bacterium]